MSEREPRTEREQMTGERDPQVDSQQELEDVGAEGGGSAEHLPGAPSSEDDTPLGDTDQHSEVPSPPAQTG